MLYSICIITSHKATPLCAAPLVAASSWVPMDCRTIPWGLHRTEWLSELGVLFLSIEILLSSGALLEICPSPLSVFQLPLPFYLSSHPHFKTTLNRFPLILEDSHTKDGLSVINRIHSLTLHTLAWREWIWVPYLCGSQSPGGDRRGKSHGNTLWGRRECSAEKT